MKRRSAIPTLIRLAELDERRALQALGKIRGAVTNTEREVVQLQSQVGKTYSSFTIPAGKPVSRDALLTNHQHIALLTRDITRRETQLVEERAREEEVRSLVAETKLKVRALRNVEKRRAERERFTKIRRDQMRLDEMARVRTNGEIV